ncbi:hypothetical protein ACJBU6_00055 [Exserohilum turcicum]
MCTTLTRAFFFLHDSQKMRQDAMCNRAYAASLPAIPAMPQHPLVAVGSQQQQQKRDSMEPMEPRLPASTATSQPLPRPMAVSSRTAAQNESGKEKDKEKAASKKKAFFKRIWHGLRRK